MIINNNYGYSKGNPAPLTDGDRDWLIRLNDSKNGEFIPRKFEKFIEGGFWIPRSANTPKNVVRRFTMGEIREVAELIKRHHLMVKIDRGETGFIAAMNVYELIENQPRFLLRITSTRLPLSFQGKGLEEARQKALELFEHFAESTENKRLLSIEKTNGIETVSLAFENFRK